jgi:hypothetical protein
MSLEVLLVLAAVLAGVVVILKRVAPLTKNTVDDKVLAVAEPLSEKADSLLLKKK